MKILGLDISSATIGYAFIDAKSKSNIILVEQGHIKPPSKKKSNNNFSLRLDFAFNEITSLTNKLNPDVAVIEDYAKKFTKGRSSANTIITLACFNEVCGLAVYKVTKMQPLRISVSHIRTIVENEYSEKIDDKEDVLKFCQKYFPNFLTVLDRNGNTKKEVYDEADALIASVSFFVESK